MSDTPTVVVLGAAGGIGSATVAAFRERGARVVGVDRVPWPGATGRDESGGAAGDGLGSYHHLVADATDPAALRGALADAAAGGPVHHVVTLVGGAHPDEVGVDDIVDLPEAALRDSILLNLTSAALIAQAAMPHLRRAGAGASLTFTGSINATAGIGLHAYSAAKAGLLSLARTLAVAEGRHGVRVNVVLPGTVITPRGEREFAGQRDHFDRMRESTALGDTAAARQVAAAFTALALDLTAVTGQSLTVDAGQTARWR